MPAPATILDLVARFRANLDSYKRGLYNETQVRREFIDPFFDALGWDVANRQGYAEAYKDVVHEEAIKVGGGTKAPDYGFRIGGTRKFFVEAKKPSVDIKGDVHPAYQLRRYAWSAKLPLSILTDFEEFAVYDCRVRPDKGDKPSAARVMYLTFDQYADCWDEIAGVFARDAILKGSFDKYAEAKGGKRGTAEVDAAFLAEIERWRDLLAHTIALRNAALSQRELNFAVQQTIDRIIFLRICEDRGIEPYGALLGLVNGAEVYQRLLLRFRHADTRYNSGLFHFETDPKGGRGAAPDTLTPRLAIDDKVLAGILRSLYYPDSPYEFSVLPGDILGQVYEQFLGKVIRLTAGHRAVVEEKPAVRKAGGVFYTPTYIVDTIVRRTLGKLLAGLTLRQVAGLAPRDGHKATPVRVADIACGSGSFLLGAYQFLLDWYLAAYLADGAGGADKWATGRNPRLYQNDRGEWRLTIGERKRILLDHIYGVDIDPQAVEVTKLSLLLKVLEGEDEQTIGQQLALFPERALPDLGRNIKCGNSLVGSDFYEGRQMALLTDEEALRVNVFDWAAEFPQVFADGGFDVVVGNPPYVLLQDEFRDNEQSAYFRSKFSGASFKIDTYHLFIEQGIRLTRDGGYCSMITPANFLTNNHLAELRRFVLESSVIDHILVIDDGVFRSVSVDNAIFVVSPGQARADSFRVVHAKVEGGQLIQTADHTISVPQVLGIPHLLFTGTSSAGTASLWEHLASISGVLGSIADVNFGKQLRDRKVFKEDVIEVDHLDQIEQPYKPCFTGRDIRRYSLRWGNLACLDDEVARSGGCWDSEKHNAKNKLLTRQIGRYPEFALDEAGYQCLNTLFMVNVRASGYDPRFVLGILNSRLLQAFWLDRFFDQRRTFPKIKGTYLKQLPIRTIDFASRADVARHDRMVSLVERMLDLHKKLASEGTPHVKTVLQRQIEATDRQIDALVYDLYGLTDEEIAVVDG